MSLELVLALGAVRRHCGSVLQRYIGKTRARQQGDVLPPAPAA